MHFSPRPGLIQKTDIYFNIYFVLGLDIVSLLTGDHYLCGEVLNPMKIIHACLFLKNK